MTFTQRYYDTNAESFCRETSSVDMSEHYSKFLAHMPKNGSILDAGCGSGRDTLHFNSLGFRTMAFDSSPTMVSFAEKTIDQKVLLLSFEELTFEDEFDGIWACASLLHIASLSLPDVFERLNRALRKSGILYCSFKYGEFEGERGGRYFTDLTEETLTEINSKAQFGMIEHWLSKDLRPGRESELWLNALLRKTEIS